MAAVRLRLSVVNFNSTIPRAQSFIISYLGFRFTNVKSSQVAFNAVCQAHTDTLLQ